MQNVSNIYQSSEILEGLKQSFLDVEASFGNIDHELFVRKENGKWSIAENLEHLILSTKPVASALKLPKITFKLLGKSKEGSRTYSELHNTYLEILSRGPVTTSKYTPDSQASFDKSELLRNWKMIAGKMQQRLNEWTEGDLDQYRLPHPALGKLTFREMLFFTIFHNYHHLKAINKIKGTI